MIGERFTRWVVLERAASRPRGRLKKLGSYWLCRCDCGVQREVARRHLTSGASHSCGCYKEGHSGVYVHRLHTEAEKKARSLSLMGHKRNVGVKHTEETKKKWSQLRKGNTWRRGTKQPQYLKDKQRKLWTGEGNPRWKGGVSKEQRRRYRSTEYAQWRTSVFERDGYRCRQCGEVGFLHAHHIKSFAKYPDLRFVLDSGLTLCKTCHMGLHKLLKAG